MAARSSPHFANDESAVELAAPDSHPGDRRASVGHLSVLLEHDLKTPLATIAMNLDFALAQLKLEPTDGLRLALQDSQEANARTIRLVSDMADAARLSDGEFQPSFAPIATAQVIQSVVQRAKAHASERGIHVLCTTDHTVLTADADLLSRMLERLVERAIRHARPGSHVEIEQRSRALSVRAETMAGAASEAALPCIAAHFAEVVMKAQGGSAWTETPAADVLVFRITLPGP